MYLVNEYSVFNEPSARGIDMDNFIVNYSIVI